METLLLKGFKRINESLSPQLLPPDELAGLVNMVLDDKGGHPVQRHGFTRFNTNAIDISDPIKGIADVYTEGGNNYVLGTETTNLKKSLDGTGTWSNVKTGLTTGLNFKITPYAGKFIITNGTDAPFVIGGDTLGDNWDLEIARPDTSDVITQLYDSVGGNLTANAKYKWLLVYVTETGEMSMPSQPFTHYHTTTNNYATSATNLKLYFEDLPVSSDSRVVKRYLFRTEGGTSATTGLIYYLHSILDNTATVMVDNKADSDLDTSLSITFLRVPNSADHICVHRNRLFLANINVDVLNYFEPAGFAQKGTSTTYEGDTYDDGEIFEVQSVAGSGTALNNGEDYMWRAEFVDANTNQSLGYVDTPSFTNPLGGLADATLQKVPAPYFGASQKINPESYKVKLYRTIGNGSTFKYLDTLEGNTDTNVFTSTYVDTTGDGSLGADYAAPGTEDYPSGIAFSDIGVTPNFILEDIRNIFPDDGDEITGIYDDIDGVLVFKKDSICKLYTNGSPQNWRVVKLVDGIGATDSDSIARDIGYYFVHNDRVYYFDGSLDYISETYEDTFDDVTAIHSSVAVDNWYVVSVTIGAGFYTLVYDKQLKTWYKFQLHSSTAVPLLAKKIYGSFAGKILSTKDNYLTYYNEAAYQDNPDGAGSDDISVTLRTKTFHFPDGISKARLRKLWAYYNRQGNITLKIVNDTTNNSYSDTSTTGWKEYEKVIASTDNILKTKTFYLELTGILRELGALRVDYRPIKEGQVAGY